MSTTRNANSRRDHPLKQMLTEERAALLEVAAKDPALWTLLGDMGLIVEALIGEATQIDKPTTVEALRMFLWQSIGKYQFQALRLFLSRELDAGYTLLRNATELTRDVAAIGDDPERAMRWLDSKFADRRDQIFRFDASDPQQEAVHQLYKVCSNWGTHGHYSALVRGGRIVTVGPRQSVEVRQITDAGVREAIILWLSGFLPIQVLCVERFAKAHPERFRRPTELLLELGDLAGMVMKRLRGA